MKFKWVALILCLALFASGYVYLGNLQYLLAKKNEQKIKNIASNRDALPDACKADTVQEKICEIALDNEMEAPPTKIPPISMNVGPLLRAVLERVWVTKYFGAPAEIYQISSDMPFCETLPDPHPEQEMRGGVFLWRQKCLPLEIRWKENKKDLSGTAVVRMLDFDGADKVLEEAFKIIKANSLGVYRVEKEKQDAIKNLIKEELGPYDSKFPINYKYKLKTYSILEDYHFPEDILGGASSEFEKKQEEIRKYFSYRGRKYALTIKYNNEFVKTGNAIEYYLTAPPGFFGMESNIRRVSHPL